MTTQLTRRTARRLTRRFAPTVAEYKAEYKYASRRMIELNTTWLPRYTTAAASPDLAAELATYRTPAELADLHAMLQQYPDEQTAEIRAILEEQAERRLFNQPSSRSAV
jgi:hypothetical protein